MKWLPRSDKNPWLFRARWKKQIWLTPHKARVNTWHVYMTNIPQKNSKKSRKSSIESLSYSHTSGLNSIIFNLSLGFNFPIQNPGRGFWPPAWQAKGILPVWCIWTQWSVCHCHLGGWPSKLPPSRGVGCVINGLNMLMFPPWTSNVIQGMDGNCLNINKNVWKSVPEPCDGHQVQQATTSWALHHVNSIRLKSLNIWTRASSTVWCLHSLNLFGTTLTPYAFSNNHIFFVTPIYLHDIIIYKKSISSYHLLYPPAIKRGKGQSPN